MGGMGSIWGTLIGGIVLGVAQVARRAGVRRRLGDPLSVTRCSCSSWRCKPSGFFARTVTT